MSFRTLDLEEYNLVGVTFRKRLTEEAARHVIGAADEQEEELHLLGYHPYTISGADYWADVHVLQIADVEEDDQKTCGFEVTLWNRKKPDESSGQRLVRREVTGIIERAGEADEEGFIANATFTFSSEDYASPLVPKQPAPEVEEATPDLSEGYRLRPSGVRYSAEKGLLDVIVDTVPGPIRVSILTSISERLSLPSMRDAIKDLREIAGLFVDRVGEVESDG